MNNKMNYEDFAPAFGPWAEKFKPFIESEAFFNIYDKIKKDAKHEVIVPDSSSTFRAFVTTNPSNMKVIFYLMDPYPRRYKDKKPQATGIAMDCSNSPDGKLQPSLTKFYDAIQKELKEEIEYSPSLEYLHQQGCMMLNTDLTCKLNKSGSHDKLWEPFQKYFLEEIMGSHTGMIYVLCGKSSHRMEKFIMPMGNYIFKLDHPASAEYGNKEWDSKGVFTMINQILRDNQNSHIFWSKKEWEEEPPF